MNGKWLNEKVILRFLCGEYSELYVDGLVCPCNEELALLPPYAAGIVRKGGGAVLAAIEELGPLPLGEAIITPGGGLLAEYVIQVALQPSGKKELDAGEAASLLETGVSNCLWRAHEMGFITVGFPLLAPVFPQLRPEQCGQSMIRAIEKLITSLPENSIWEVIIQAASPEELSMLDSLLSV